LHKYLSYQFPLAQKKYMFFLNHQYAENLRCLFEINFVLLQSKSTNWQVETISSIANFFTGCNFVIHYDIQIPYLLQRFPVQSKFTFTPSTIFTFSSCILSCVKSIASSAEIILTLSMAIVSLFFTLGFLKILEAPPSHDGQTDN